MATISQPVNLDTIRQENYEQSLSAAFESHSRGEYKFSVPMFTFWVEILPNDNPDKINILTRLIEFEKDPGKKLAWCTKLRTCYLIQNFEVKNQSLSIEIANLNIETKNYEEARKGFSNALERAKMSNDLSSEIKYSFRLIDIEILLNNWDSALEYCSRCFNKFSQNPCGKWSCRFFLLKIPVLFLLLNETEEAMNWINQILKSPLSQIRMADRKFYEFLVSSFTSKPDLDSLQSFIFDNTNPPKNISIPEFQMIKSCLSWDESDRYLLSFYWNSQIYELLSSHIKYGRYSDFLNDLKAYFNYDVDFVIAPRKNLSLQLIDHLALLKSANVSSPHMLVIAIETFNSRNPKMTVPLL